MDQAYVKLGIIHNMSTDGAPFQDPLAIINSLGCRNVWKFSVERKVCHTPYCIESDSMGILYHIGSISVHSIEGHNDP